MSTSAMAQVRPPHLYHNAVCQFQTHHSLYLSPLRAFTATETGQVRQKIHTPTHTLTLTTRWAEMHRFIRLSAPQTMCFQNKVLWHSALCNYTMMDSTTSIMEPLCATSSPGWICSRSLTGAAQRHYEHEQIKQC